MKYSETKQHIIEVASNLFYKNGYNSTGINEIIAEAGIAKATLYNNFKSKEDICIEYLRYKNFGFLSEIEEFAKSQPHGKSQILALFDFLHTFFLDKDFNGCWCIKTVSEIPRDNDRVRIEIQDQKNVFIKLIADLVRNNLKYETDQEVISLSRRIYLLYESAVAESHLHEEDWPINESRKLCSEILG